MATRAGILRAQRLAVGGKRKRCKIGKSCSAACVNRNKFCLVDMPAPVEGALAKAVKAVRTRKERLSRRQEVKVGVKRRQYVKSKLKASLEDRKHREAVKVLTNSIKGSLLKGNIKESQRLINKLESLTSKQKGRSNTVSPGTKSIYDSSVSSMVESLKKLASTGNKKEFTALEEKLKKVQDWWFDKYGGTANFTHKVRTDFLWDDYWGKALKKIEEKLNVYQDKLVDYTNKKDRSSYNRLERKYLQVQRAVQSKGSNLGRLTLSKGYIWETTTKRNYKEKYEKLVIGIEDRMRKAAESGNRGEYDRLERNRIRLNGAGSKFYKPEYKKGYIWNGVKAKQYKQAIEDLTKGLMDAARAKDRGAYDKLEKKLLKIQKEIANSPFALKTVSKGEIWRDHRKLQYVRVRRMLLSRMESSALKGDRGKYNELEKKLLLLQKSLGGFRGDNAYVKGDMWSSLALSSRLTPLNTERDFVKADRITRGSYTKELALIEATSAYRAGVYKADSPEEKSLDKGGYERIKGRLGSEGLSASLNAIRDYTSENYGNYVEIRSQQKAGVRSTKGDAIERLINDPDMDKPRVVKYRGAAVSDDRLSKLISSVGGTSREGTTSSWSTSLSVARSFPEEALNTRPNDNIVIFRAVNKRGISVEALSSTKEEYEILTSKDATYRVKSHRVIRIKGRDYHVFDMIES